MLRTHPTSTLFPYTTLFRSHVVHVKDRHNIAYVEQRLRQRIALALIGRGKLARDAARDRLAQNEFHGVGVWCFLDVADFGHRSEEHTSELQSQSNLVCRLLL